MIALEETLTASGRATADVEHRVQKLAKKGQLTLHEADKPTAQQALLAPASTTASSSSDATKDNHSTAEDGTLLPDVWANNDEDDRDWTGAAPIRKSVALDPSSVSKEKESNRLKKKAIVENDDDDDDMFGGDESSPPAVMKNSASANRGFKSAFTLDDDSD